ncbi:MATE family efflux transporter [Kiloniella sp. EL199]|uniref:MATE family efflux transporter n=1 Tax=Kiloniella sp. EL199 TaxID=2107581 RepID=UPI0020B124BA|nr:MATE family efflux transporter [Kiloniella sp. EL199]
MSNTSHPLKNSPNSTGQNFFLFGSLPLLFVKTATPIILVMLVNGLFTLVDAYFLGEFVSADALTAVTMMFPVFMLIVALSTWVSGGFSSVLARLLGAREFGKASAAFTSAFALSGVICLMLIAIFSLGGDQMINWVTKGSEILGAMGYTYISILIYGSPLIFILTISVDALRCEGKLGFMTFISVLSTLLNVLFNYILIVQMDQGVAGSAYGTLLAQTLSLIAIIIYRYNTSSTISFTLSPRKKVTIFWRNFLALGAPQSLSYLGISLSSGAVFYSLQKWGGNDYEATVTAYGITTRILTFSFLPLLGLNLGFQTIAGNNQGAQIFSRVNSSLRIAILAAFSYCLALQLIFDFMADSLGSIFVDDPKIISETARILPLITLLYFAFGPSLILSGFFQAIGDAKRSALISLTRTYIFSIPLTFILPLYFGEIGIWYSGPLTEILMILLTLFILSHNANRTGYKLGLFKQETTTP